MSLRPCFRFVKVNAVKGRSGCDGSASSRFRIVCRGSCLLSSYGWCIRVFAAQTLADRSAGTKESNANRRLGPPLLLSDLLDLETFEIMTLQNHTVVVLAGFQNSANINSCEIDFGLRREFGQCLQQRLTPD